MKRALQATAGAAVSAVALWLTLRGKNLGSIWEATRSADYRYLLPYLVLLLAIHLVRTVRWGILLEPVAKVPFGRLNSVSAVGFMALMLLPFRLGEFARPYLVAERPHLRVSAALSSVVVERVVDGLFTAIMLMVALLAIPAAASGLPLLRAAGALVFLGFASLMVFLVVAYRNRALAVGLTQRLVAPLSASSAERVAGMMDAFIHGLRLVPSRGKLVLFVLLTVAYWGMAAAGIVVLGRAFSLELTAAQAVTTLGALVVGSMIPAGPGMVGTFQASVLLALALFVPRDQLDTHGTAFANVMWLAQLGQQVALGMVFLFSRHIRFDRILNAPAEVGHGLEKEEAEYQHDEGADLPTSPKAPAGLEALAGHGEGTAQAVPLPSPGRRLQNGVVK